MKDEIKKMTTQELTARVHALRIAASNPLNYEKCKLQAQPFLDEINKRTQDIAKKHNRRVFKFSFAGFGRNLK